jgi:hypothetical protein
MPGLRLHIIRERISQLALKETIHIATSDSNLLYVRKDSEHEYYAWHNCADKSLKYQGPIDCLMKIVSELRRGMGQSKNKLKKASLN